MEDLLSVLEVLLTHQFEVDREDKCITIDFAEYSGAEHVKQVAQLLEDTFEQICIRIDSQQCHEITVKISMRKRT